jgi:hypothetical protein
MLHGGREATRTAGRRVGIPEPVRRRGLCPRRWPPPADCKKRMLRKLRHPRGFRGSLNIRARCVAGRGGAAIGAWRGESGGRGGHRADRTMVFPTLPWGRGCRASGATPPFPIRPEPVEGLSRLRDVSRYPGLVPGPTDRHGKRSKMRAFPYPHGGPRHRAGVTVKPRSERSPDLFAQGEAVGADAIASCVGPTPRLRPFLPLAGED